MPTTFTQPITRDWYSGADLHYTLYDAMGLAVARTPMSEVPAGSGCFEAYPADLSNDFVGKIVFDDGSLFESEPFALMANVIQGNAEELTLTAASGEAGDGDTAVDHNTGGIDAMQVLLGGVGADNVRIIAFLKSDYDAGNRTDNRGVTYTGPDGRWVNPLLLNSGQVYTLIFQIPGLTQPDVVELTVP